MRGCPCCISVQLNIVISRIYGLKATDILIQRKTRIFKSNFSFMKKRMIYGIIISIFYIISCNDRYATTDTTVTGLAEAALIPKPVSITTGNAVFELTGKSSIYVEGGSQELMNIGQWLADKLNPPTGFDMKVKDSKGTPGSGNNIYLSVSDNDPEL